MAFHQHHHHSTSGQSHNRAFALGIGLNVAFVAVEAAFGIAYGSLALLADAGHNLSDVLGLLLAWGAARLATAEPTSRRTYGLRRTTILASLLSALLLLVAIGGLSWEAVSRLGSPARVSGIALMIVSGIGILINGGTALLFRRGRKHDLNIRGAYLHMVADAGVSFGVVLAGALIWLTGWLWLDPAISLVIALIVLLGTLGLLRESVDLALDAVPRGIDPESVRSYLRDLPEVVGLHDLHIWGLSTTESSLTVHLMVPAARCDDSFLHGVSRELEARFNICHSTIQIERGDVDQGCRQARPGSL